MKQTDEQIIASVRKILDELHNPDTGFNAFRKELREQHLKKEECEQRIIDKEYELAKKYGLTKANNRDEVKFKLTGEDVMNSRLYVSCGQAAKAFCYVHDKLVKEGKIKQPLDLKVLFSTDIEHLIDAKEGHTLPCVELSDGKYHAIEPQIQPEKDKQPGFQFVCDDVKVGAEIWHQLESIKEKGRPYKITKIVTPEEHKTIYSDFGKFLKACRVLDHKIAFVCGTLEEILQNQNPGQYKNGKRQLYEICKALNGKNTPVKVWVFTKGEDTAYRIGIEHDGVYYDMNPTVQYLSLSKSVGVDGFKFNEPGFKLTRTLTPQEYISEFERNQNALMVSKGKTLE